MIGQASYFEFTTKDGVKIVSGHVVRGGDIANGPPKLVDVGDAELVELVK